jgi:TPR repeat protein
LLLIKSEKQYRSQENNLRNINIFPKSLFVFFLLLPIMSAQTALSDSAKSTTEVLQNLKIGTDDQKAEALSVLIERADSGNLSALLALGGIYLDGTSVPEDLHKSFGFYKNAYKQAPASAAYKLGNMYYKYYVELNLDQKDALGLFTEAANEGDMWATAALGDVYRDGKIVPINVYRALEFYRKALELGNQSVFGRIGVLYYRNGQELHVDRSVAIDYLQKAVDRHEPLAMVNLGDIYREGQLLPVDISKAMALYASAAELGNGAASGRLGDLYYRDFEPLGLDRSKATLYYRTGVQYGDVRSMIGLGDLYRDGIIISANYNLALEQYRNALQSGSMIAAGRIGDLYYQHARELNVPKKEAVSFYEMGVQKGDVASFLGLANVYRDGKIVAKNISKASELYGGAYERGSLKARILEIKMLLGSNSGQQKKGLFLLRSALNEKLPGATSIWADANLYGWGLRANAKRALAILNDGVASGDTTAAFRLVTLYTQGYQTKVKRNELAARQVLARIAKQAEKSRIDTEEIYILGSFANTPNKQKDFISSLRQLDRVSRASIAGRVSWINQQAFVSAVQDDLGRRGEYTGPTDGRLSRQTMKAFQIACKRIADDRNDCTKQPLTDGVRIILADSIKRP